MNVSVRGGVILLLVISILARCSLGQSGFSRRYKNNYVKSRDLEESSGGLSSSENKSDTLPSHDDDTSGSGVKSSACDCMDYWQCAAKNGQVYSYCGISDSEVCCFISPDGQTSKVNEVIFSFKEDEAVEEEDDKRTTTTVTDEGSVVHTTTVSLLDPGFEVTSSTCGIAEIPVQINSNARFQEWPWHVAILEASHDLYICGAALVSPGVVITAAHCISAYTSKSSRKLKVRAGEFDVTGNHEVYPHVEVPISKITIHPEFNNASLVNDIAVVHIARNLTYGPHIQALCLPPLIAPPRRKIPFDNQVCVVTGWGRISEDGNHSTKLKEVPVKLWSKDRCEERLRRNFGQNFVLPATSLCAVDEKGQDGGVCDGDGGGPLACWNKEDGKWYQRGIVSFGIGCGRPDSPGVYSRVSSYTKWISQVI